MSKEDRAVALESARHWAGLAQEQMNRARDNEERGLYSGVEKSKAMMYQKTANALMLEARSSDWTSSLFCMCRRPY